MTVFNKLVESVEIGATKYAYHFIIINMVNYYNPTRFLNLIISAYNP